MDVQNMTPAEIRAFNAGVRAAMNCARRAAEALRASTRYRETREGFAIAALDELATAGEALLQGPPAAP